MLSWLRSRFKKKHSSLELLERIANTKDLLDKTRLSFTELGESDFEFFYTKYFTFIVQLPNIEQTNRLLIQYQRLIEAQQYITDVRLAEFTQYSTETFFIRENNTYIDKIQSLKTLKTNVLALIETLTHYNDTSSVDIPTFDYYCRRLNPVLESLTAIVIAYLELRASIQT